MSSSLPVPVGSTHRPHIILFPFMSKGHTIPILLHLAHLLLNRGIMVTVFTTKANHSFIAHFLQTRPDGHGSIFILNLPFPSDIEGVPQGIESTDQLPSIAVFNTLSNVWDPSARVLRDQRLCKRGELQYGF
ncbi:hypothetical protein SSX86_031072 [Deinandra increscens subsp. villosa]|uniref:Glucosyltransferase n=1 Tax=Deinandra increscens subsp. villosa TaxID=3103831 RepID=A0AAP0CAB2_9ASTR